MEDKREVPKSKFKWELSGTSNNGFRHRYSILKDESFRNNFLNFMDSLGFNWEGIEKNFCESDDSKNGFVNIIDIIDVCWYFQNELYDVDVFFGSSKIILLVRTKDRRKLIDSLVELSEFIDPVTVEDVLEVEVEGEKVAAEIESN